MLQQLHAIAIEAQKELQMVRFPHQRKAEAQRLLHCHDQLECREFVAVDIETTGNNLHVDEPVEIGAVRFNFSGDILDRFHAYVKPSRPVDDFAFKTHQIDADILRRSPELKNVLPDLIDFLGGEETLVIQHSDRYFDTRILGFAMLDLGLEHPTHAIVDTMNLARKLVMVSRLERESETGDASYSLAVLCRIFGISEEQRHRALPDAEMTMQLFLQLCHCEPQRLFKHKKKLQQVQDIFRAPEPRYSKKPRFFTNLPMQRQVPQRYKEILQAINNREALEIQVRSETGDISGVIHPLWFTESSDKRDDCKYLVYRMAGQNSRERILMEHVVRWKRFETTNEQI